MAGCGIVDIFAKNTRGMNTYLYPLHEAHVRLFQDGNALHIDGLPAGPDSLSLPAFYHNGTLAIFHFLESMLPGLVGINILGIWTEDPDKKGAPFCAFDLWVQTCETEGFYLPMASAHSLFSQNGIPYFHKPLIEAL